jgi:hypothetical protein
LEEEVLNPILLEQKLSLFWQAILGLIAEAEDSERTGVLLAEVPASGQLFQFVAAADEVRVGATRTKIVVQAVICPYPHSVEQKGIQVVLHIRLMKLLQY